MFKLVVLCAFVVAAVAEPKPDPQIVVSGVPGYSTFVSPATTSISSQSSSVIHPSPISYSTQLLYSHYIKKRSPQFLAPAFNAAYYPNYPVARYVSTAPYVYEPAVYSNAHLPVATHLIKKRSAQFIPATYYTPTTYVSSPAISTPYLQTHYYTNARVPLFNTHLIKKRSAAYLPTTYLAPSAYSVATTPYLRSPYLTSPTVLTNTVYSAPATIPLATTHFIKKRSPDQIPEPTLEGIPVLV